MDKIALRFVLRYFFIYYAKRTVGTLIILIYNGRGSV